MPAPLVIGGRAPRRLRTRPTHVAVGVPHRRVAADGPARARRFRPGAGTLDVMHGYVLMAAGVGASGIVGAQRGATDNYGRRACLGPSRCGSIDAFAVRAGVRSVQVVGADDLTHVGLLPSRPAPRRAWRRRRSTAWSRPRWWWLGAAAPGQRLPRGPAHPDLRAHAALALRPRARALRRGRPGAVRGLRHVTGRDGAAGAGAVRRARLTGSSASGQASCLRPQGRVSERRLG
ncbi:MAG: hypothetical protein JWN65_1510 [Solirubrobacterales bacterium]|nr:hypothetical protein [Solirubrobacterales bacterium]